MRMGVGDLEVIERGLSLSAARSSSDAVSHCGFARSSMTAPLGLDPRTARPAAAGDAIGVALHDFYPRQRHVQIFRDDLRVGGLVSLARRLRADEDGEVARLHIG